MFACPNPQDSIVVSLWGLERYKIVLRLWYCGYVEDQVLMTEVVDRGRVDGVDVGLHYVVAR
jgi:hypothetical protein